MPATRRRVLTYALSGAAVLATGGCSSAAVHGHTKPFTGPAPGSGSGVAVTAAPGTSVVQIVAHPDDDLYFINPETSQFLRAGVPLTTVYLTAGESTGLGRGSWAVRHGEVPVLDRAHFAAERFNGSRRAYARMATGDMDSPWDRSATVLASGTVAEVAVLRAAPHVRLVVLGMLEAGDRRREYRGRSLAGLVAGTALAVPTLVMPDSPVTSQYAYTRDKVLAALGHVLTDARPTLVCTLDPDPEHKRGRHGKGAASTDHADHTASARLAVTAVERYRPPAGSPAPVLQSYRGYANELYPRNLDPFTLAAKTATLATYSGHGLPCAVPYGCGDHQVDLLRLTRKRFDTTQHRHRGDVHWLRPLPDGRLTAFTVSGGQVVQWTQKTPGAAAWADPVPLPGGDLFGHVSAVSLPDGRIRLFALRHGGLVGAPAAQRRQVVTTVQDAPGGRFGQWRDLGGPDGVRGPKARELGLPYAAVDRLGRVHVVVRTYTRALALRTLSATGRWGPWRRLPGPADVQDGLFLLPRADGRTEIYAGTRTHLYRWTLPPRGRATAARLPLPVPSCAPTAVELPGGGTRLFLRPGGSGTVHAHDERKGGAWTPAAAYPAGGYGPVAVAALAGGGHVTATRNDAGAVSTRAWAAGSGAAPRPAEHAVLLTGVPSLARDRAGRTFLAVQGADGMVGLVRVDRLEPRA